MFRSIAIARRISGKRSWRFAGSIIVAWALALALVVSCSKDSPAPHTEPLPLIVNTSSASAMIGPAGGTVTHASGAQLIIPPGALTADTHISLTGIAPPSAAVLGGTPLGQGFQAGPDGQVFLKPVDVVIPFDPTRLAPGSTVASAQVRMAPSGSTAFVALQSVADLTARTIRAKTIHFTQFLPVSDATSPLFGTFINVLPPATVGVPYSCTLTASGGTPPYTWTLENGSTPPPGLSFDSSGTMSGTAATATVFEFFALVTDAAGHALGITATLTILPDTNPLPALTKIAPTSATQGDAATTVNVTGSDFVPTTQVTWDGSPLPTVFEDSTRLYASISASLLLTTGPHQISVSTPAPGGGTSANLPFQVNVTTNPNPVPAITLVSPSTLPVSNVDTSISISGTGFLPSTSAALSGQSIQTNYQSSTLLTATIPASYLATAGTLTIAVTNPAPGGGVSSSATIAVGSLNPAPTLASIAPSSIPKGASDFLLTVTGTNFVSGAQIFFGSTALATTRVSSITATATVATALVETAGTISVAIANPAPGGGVSPPQPFTVTSVDGGVDAADPCPGSPGALDLTFGDGGVITWPSTMDPVEGSHLAIQAGKILIGGANHNTNNSLLLRVDESGVLDPTFGDAGVVANGLLTGGLFGLAVQSDDKILVSGTVQNSTLAIGIERHLPNGDIDPSFGDLGSVLTQPTGNDQPQAGIVVQSDGKIVVGGIGDAGGPTSYFELVRYSGSGALDTSFGPSGNGVSLTMSFTGSASRLALLPSGKFLMAGQSPGGFTLVQYLANGVPDSAFAAAGIAIGNFGDTAAQAATSLAIDTYGRIVLVGLRDGTDRDFQVARYLPDGTVDTTFGTGGRVTTDFGGRADTAVDVAILPSGRIVVAGTSNMVNATSGNTEGSFAIARYLTDGTLDATFGTGGKVLTSFQPSGSFSRAAGAMLDSNPCGFLVTGGVGGDPLKLGLVRYLQ